MMSESSQSAQTDTESTIDTESPLPGADRTGQVENAEIQLPEFQTFNDAGEKAQHEMSRFGDIKVTVSAELGRTQLAIDRLMTLGKGSVLELDRSIDQPVELIAQGIPLASGEVVVVDGHFAIRILNVYPRNRRGENLKGEK